MISFIDVKTQYRNTRAEVDTAIAKVIDDDS